MKKYKMPIKGEWKENPYMTKELIEYIKEIKKNNDSFNFDLDLMEKSIQDKGELMPVIESVEELEEWLDREECELCGTKENVEVRLDPFEYDVNNTEVYKNLCKNCEHELNMDI